MGPGTNGSTSVKYPPSDRHPIARTLIALFGSPTAWVTQMSLSEPIAAYACYPYQVPLSAPLWVELSLILGMISLVCLAAGLFSGYVSWTFWQYTGGSAGDAVATARGTNDSQGAAVDAGQNRFLAMIGLMSSSLFIIAIIFTCCAIFLVPPCSAWI